MAIDYRRYDLYLHGHHFFLFQNLNHLDLTKGKSKLRDFDGLVLF